MARFTDSGGTGEPLVLIHAGVFADWFVPLTAEPALAGLRRVRVTRTGYEPGDSAAGPLSVQDHADELAQVLASLGITRARVVSHSSGAVFALQLAMDHPDLVKDLVLIEPPLLDVLTPSEDHEVIGQTVGAAIGDSVGAAMRDNLPLAFDTFMTALCGPEHRSVIRASLGSGGLDKAERDCRYFFTGEIMALAQWPFDKNLAQQISQPVLLVAGGASPPTTHRLVAHLAAMLPSATTTTIPRQDHLLPLRTPAALAELIA